jgi:micrococcal nuclease
MDVSPERAAPGGPKQATHFGRQALAWARETYFKDHTEVDLEFPSDKPWHSNSGKLLAYAIAQGDNYNVRLVREGWSPCFEKYGLPRIHRAEMAGAELRARLEGRGIWGGLGGRGDYAALKAYWAQRAGQVESYRNALFMGEDILSTRMDGENILARAKAGAAATVFADVQRSCDVSDGSLLIQIGSPQLALCAHFPPSARSLAAFVEREYLGPFKSNYLFFTGQLSLAGPHPQIAIERPDQLSSWPSLSAY